jgi:predicted transcriptional regulator
MAKEKQKPSELELQVLSVLWAHGPLPVRKVHELLPDGKKRAYTTVLTVLQGMEKKKLVNHTREGMANIYKPLVTQKQTVTPFMKQLLQNVFGGDPSAVVQCLLDSSNPDKDELKEIRRLINEAAKNKKS